MTAEVQGLFDLFDFNPSAAKPHLPYPLRKSSATGANNPGCFSRVPLLDRLKRQGRICATSAQQDNIVVPATELYVCEREGAK